MSGIFGIFNRNGKAVDRDIAHKMLDAMSYWDPDEKDLYIDGPVAMGHAMLWNTPESKYEHLPLVKDGYVLTMDARIDNREELAKEIELPDRPMSEIGDSEFILAAYKKWGEECPKHLLGDFTFVIWDSKKEQVFCVRDHIGIKSLFYYLDDKKIVFANDIQTLLIPPDIPRTFNEAAISIFLKGHGFPIEEETFFKHIYKLPPASTRIIELRKTTASRYWNPEDVSAIVYDSLEDYTEALRTLYHQAIEARMRTAYPLSSHLSGGIDSSPIAIYAARQLRQKAQTLYAFNWIDVPEDDEKYEYEAWSFSRQIAKQENIHHIEFRSSPHDVVTMLNQHNVFTKGFVYAFTEDKGRKIVSSYQCRTILSGWGGDELISYGGYTYLESLFAQGKISTAYRYLLYDKKRLNLTWIALIKRTLRVLYSWIKIVWPYRREINAADEYNYYQYIRPKFRNFMKYHKTVAFPHTVGVRNMQLALYHHGHLHNRIESWDLSAKVDKIEYRYPLLDKRIVEFALAIPESLYFPDEDGGRPLFRRAVSDLSPKGIVNLFKKDEPKVSKFFEKTYFNSYILLQKNHFLKQDNLDIHLQDYIDESHVLSALQKFDPNTTDFKEVGNLIPVILILRSLSKLRV